MLSVIAEDTKPAALALRIRELRRNSIADVIEIGRLLVDAKSMLTHGEWLPWLRSKALLSPACATNYVNAYAFARNRKFTTVANLTPATIYSLARPSAPPAAVNLIMSQAERGPVTRRDADVILRTHRPAKSERRDVFAIAGVATALLAFPG